MILAMIADIMLTCADRCNDVVMHEDMHEEFHGMLGVPIGTLFGLPGSSNRLVNCVREAQLLNVRLP